MSARRWLDLLPWSSPPLDRERRLHAAGKLAHDLGATDLVPLQLRLLLGGGSPAAAGHGRRSNGTTVASGALDVIREVLRCNPDAVRGGAGTSGGAKGTESSAASTESMLFGSGEASSGRRCDASCQCDPVHGVVFIGVLSGCKVWISSDALIDPAHFQQFLCPESMVFVHERYIRSRRQH